MTPLETRHPQRAARLEPSGRSPAARREAAVEWGRAVLAAALGRLQATLTPGCRLDACLVQRCAGCWTVRLTCTVQPAATAAAAAGGGAAGGPVEGSGRALIGADWAAGDPRLAGGLEIALAEAAATVAERSGRGLGLFRPGSSCAPAPRAASSRPMAACRCGSARS